MSYGRPSVQLPQLTKVNKIIIIASVVLFLINSIMIKMGSGSLLSFMGLSTAKFMQGHIYTLLTYPFVSSQLMGVLFDCLLLWFLGCELESIWGEKRYISFAATSLLACAGTFILFNLIFTRGSLHYMFPLSGLGGLASAMCVAYAILFPDRQFVFMFIFPMKAKYFCLLLAGISLYSGFFTPAGAQAFAQIGAMISAVVWMIFITGQGGNVLKSLKPKGQRKSKSKAKLSIVKDDDDKPPRYWQ